MGVMPDEDQLAEAVVRHVDPRRAMGRSASGLARLASDMAALTADTARSVASQNRPTSACSQVNDLSVSGRGVGAASNIGAGSSILDKSDMHMKLLKRLLGGYASEGGLPRKADDDEDEEEETVGEEVRGKVGNLQLSFGGCSTVDQGIDLEELATTSRRGSFSSAGCDGPDGLPAGLRRTASGFGAAGRKSQSRKSEAGNRASSGLLDDLDGEFSMRVLLPAAGGTHGSSGLSDREGGALGRESARTLFSRLFLDRRQVSLSGACVKFVQVMCVGSWRALCSRCVRCQHSMLRRVRAAN